MPAPTVIRASYFSAPLPAARPDHTLVFIHIPKTAGMSLRETLLANRAPHPSHRILHPIDDYRALAAMPAEYRRALGLIEGHQYFGAHELVEQPCHYLTMLRDPLERILSYYSFVRSWEPHHLHRTINDGALTLLDCLRGKLTVELDNFQVRSLTSLRRIHIPFGGVTRSMLDEAKAHLDTFAAVGLTDRFAESVDHFCSVFGWPRSPITTINVSPRRVRHQDLDDSTLDAIRASNDLDQELYEHARLLFAARIGQGPPAFGPPHE